MDPSLLEQFLGPSSTQFQLPPLTEDENDELHPLITAGFQRLSYARKSLPGKHSLCVCAHAQGLVLLSMRTVQARSHSVSSLLDAIRKARPGPVVARSASHALSCVVNLMNFSIEGSKRGAIRCSDRISFVSRSLRASQRMVHLEAFFSFSIALFSITSCSNRFIELIN